MHLNLRDAALTLLPLLATLLASYTATVSATPEQQHPLQDADLSTQSISPRFFSSLERLSRLVDIAYCVGTTGVSPPFSCASRCRDFPSLHLVSTWNTGVLSMSDSCGYVAVDHGLSHPRDGDMPHPPAILVAFRGTYSLTNTVVDLSTVPQEYVPYPEPDDNSTDTDENRAKCTNCTVHTGFLTSWQSARALVLPSLRAARLKHPSYPIHLVGHSLGGAVAALAGLELRLTHNLSDITVTTFGEPRVGNAGLVEYLDGVFGLDDDDGYDPDLEKRRRYRRVTHVGDPVPLLPLAEWGFRSHAGEVFISKGELQPGPEDVRICRGDEDGGCIAKGAEALAAMVRNLGSDDLARRSFGEKWFPTRLKPWELFFAHRDYFWRLGLCVPGGDPSDWGRERYNLSSVGGDDEL
ncbi:alpha/beta-hydrolase [Coniochaeta ligniaria NRRL 30616]|uniref:Alpha/beta-hydrolase n=1 Tax=Coniochaeta ligniaria NRRL 30616 TaxID=1408157 RepID=A0A1J7J4I6_9PEZI|nr:alpha/beta-hydrolase [Coniochaeta ligniaria NRRL 30616]